MIDWARVDELRAEIGAEDFGEVVALFLQEADEVVARLAAGSDPARLEAELHFLKGSALNLGLRDLALLCQDGEKAAAQGLAAGVDPGAVVACYQASRQVFADGLAARMAA
jgi:HPt (histidine-containing phosphotransfer) domain-containing protein